MSGSGTKLRAVVLATLMALSAGVGIATVSNTAAAAGNTHVVAADGTGDFDSIQGAVDAATDGDVIEVGPGTYTGSIDFTDASNITVTAVADGEVVVEPSEMVEWNVGNSPNRDVAIRIVDSENIVFEGLTFDFGQVKHSGAFAGILYWNSTGELRDNTIRNASTENGNTEQTSVFQAPGYTDEHRAGIAIVNNTYVDTGRQGVATHGYVDAHIEGNEFHSADDDSGYAIELGSESVGEIVDNEIHGYADPFGDGSESAAVYVENAFTTDVDSPMTKSVDVTGNEIYDNQIGVQFGQTWHGFSANVSIDVSFVDNLVRDNALAGVHVVDENAQSGSSVTVHAANNRIENNGDVGYHVFTIAEGQYHVGDGDITLTTDGDTVTGHDTGVKVEDAGDSSDSTIDVTVTDASLAGNTVGVNNTWVAAVDATSNWWGNATGPGGAGPGDGAAVTESVMFTPWLDAPAAAGGEPTAPVFNVDEGTYHRTIQDAVDAATKGDTIEASPGTYNESISVDTEDLTLLGPNAGVPAYSSLRGPEATVNADGTDWAIRVLEQSGNVTVDGFAIEGWTQVGILQGMADSEGTAVHVANNDVDVTGQPVAHGNSIQITGDDSTVVGNDVEVTGYDTEITDWATSGILAEGVNDTEIVDNHVEYVDTGDVSSYYRGITVEGAPSFDGPATDTLVRNNTVVGLSTAISVQMDVSNTAIQENTVSDSGVGLAVRRYQTRGGTNLVDGVVPSGIDVGGNAFEGNAVQVTDPDGVLDTVHVLTTNEFDGAVAVARPSNSLQPTVWSSIQDGVDNASSGDTVAVGAGTYDESVDVNVPHVTLVGSGTVEGAVSVSVPGVTVGGLTVDTPEFTPGDSEPAGILVSASDVLVEGTTVRTKGDATGGGGSVTVHGIQVFDGGTPAVTNVTIRSNEIRSVTNRGNSGWPDYGGSAGVKVQGTVDGVDVTDNVIRDVWSAGWAYGVVVTPSGNAPSVSPKNVTVSSNRIENVTADGFDGVALGIDTESGDVGGPNPTDASEVTATRNDFVESDVGVLNKDTGHTLDATDNWWDHATGPSGAGPGTGAAVSDNVSFDPWLTSPVGVFFDVAITDVDDPVTEGDAVDVSVEVENTGTSSHEQEITLSVDGESEAGRSVQLDGGESQTVEFEVGTDQPGSLDVTVESDDASATATVTVEEREESTGGDDGPDGGGDDVPPDDDDDGSDDESADEDEEGTDDESDDESEEDGESDDSEETPGENEGDDAGQEADGDDADDEDETGSDAVEPAVEEQVDVVDQDPEAPGTTVEFQETRSVDRVTFDDEGVSGSVTVEEYDEPPESVEQAVVEQVATGSDGASVVSAFDISPSSIRAETASATVELTVSSAAVNDPADTFVAHERSDGSWERLETSVEDAGDGTLTLATKVDSFSMFAVVESSGRQSSGSTEEAGGFGLVPLVGLAAVLAIVVAGLVILRRRGTL